MTDEEREILVESLAARIAEHFDSVRIFASRTDGTVTKAFTTGRGNFYAQIGQVEEWVNERFSDVPEGDE